MTEGHNVVSVSDNTDIGEGWRVRAFYMPANWNARSRTLGEEWFKSEKQARAYARDLAAQHNATIQG